jgi:hypothetical protein
MHAQFSGRRCTLDRGDLHRRAFVSSYITVPGQAMNRQTATRRAVDPELVHRVLTDELREALHYATDEEAYLELLSVYKVERPPRPPRINRHRFTREEVFFYCARRSQTSSNPIKYLDTRSASFLRLSIG